MNLSPSRPFARKRLEAFLPRVARSYAAERNYDNGPQNRENVSMLSPYISHRALSEREVLERVLAKHDFSQVEKFVQEVVWRNYWRGWLQTNPELLLQYRHDLKKFQSVSSGDAYQVAAQGRTDFECFNVWVKELIEYGYLHNHARMWFASIWIHTLRLPWQLGAEFFMRHLYDGDDASNMLSWRWVAGLQTKGKQYVAQRSNIEKFTGGRFSPKGLSGEGIPIEIADTPCFAYKSPWRKQTARLSEESPLIVYDQDLLSGLDNIDERFLQRRVIFVENMSARLSARVREFKRELLSDAVNELASRVPNVSHCKSVELREYLEKSGVEEVVLIVPYRGSEWEDVLSLQLSSLQCHFVCRNWDSTIHQYSTRGFFPFWKSLRECLPSFISEQPRLIPSDTP